MCSTHSPSTNVALGHAVAVQWSLPEVILADWQIRLLLLKRSSLFVRDALSPDWNQNPFRVDVWNSKLGLAGNRIKNIFTSPFNSVNYPLFDQCADSARARASPMISMIRLITLRNIKGIPACLPACAAQSFRDGVGSPKAHMLTNRPFKCNWI